MVPAPGNDVKKLCSQYRPLRNTTHHWFPFGYQAIDCNSLREIIQPIAYPPGGLSVKSMCLQFGDKDVMSDSVKCFAQVKSGIQVICEDVEEHRAQDGAFGTPLVAGHQSDVTPFAVTLCAQPVSQLLTHHMMCLSSCAGHFVQKDPVRD
ncbi:hypothetical protein BTVI_50155 [Pitangus sulphuratus]|nr:hypothetical protein BTVI_50155 [Pitangus sulphuratus]